MIIACDVDGIIAPTLLALLRCYNRDYGDTLTTADITDYEIHPFVKPECGFAVYDYFKADLYNDDMLPIEGAVEGVRKLRELGHTVLLATTCYYGMVDQKAHWLEKHGFCTAAKRSGMLPDDLIVSTNKTDLLADLLIDDSPKVITQWVEAHRRAIMMGSYQKDVRLTSSLSPWLHYTNNWAEIVRTVSIL